MYFFGIFFFILIFFHLNFLKIDNTMFFDRPKRKQNYIHQFIFQ